MNHDVWQVILQFLHGGDDWLTQCMKIRQVDTTACSGVTTHLSQLVTRREHELCFVITRDHKLFGDTLLPVRSSVLSFIERLDLCDCRIDPLHMQQLVSQLKHLKQLVMQRAKGGEFLQLTPYPSPDNVPSLTSLSFHISFVTDNDLEYIAVSLLNLKSIYLRYTKGYTGVGLMKLDEYVKKILILDDRRIELEEAFESDKNESVHY